MEADGETETTEWTLVDEKPQLSDSVHKSMEETDIALNYNSSNFDIQGQNISSSMEHGESKTDKNNMNDEDYSRLVKNRRGLFEDCDFYTASLKGSDEELFDEIYLSDNKIRSYTHKRNNKLSNTLNMVLLGTIMTTICLAVGHIWGTWDDCSPGMSTSFSELLYNLQELQHENYILRSKMKTLESKENQTVEISPDMLLSAVIGNHVYTPISDIVNDDHAAESSKGNSETNSVTLNTLKGEYQALEELNSIKEEKEYKVSIETKEKRDEEIQNLEKSDKSANNIHRSNYDEDYLLHVPKLSPKTNERVITHVPNKIVVNPEKHITAKYQNKFKFKDESQMLIDLDIEKNKNIYYKEYKNKDTRVQKQQKYKSKDSQITKYKDNKKKYDKKAYKYEKDKNEKRRKTEYSYHKEKYHKEYYNKENFKNYQKKF